MTDSASKDKIKTIENPVNLDEFNIDGESSMEDSKFQLELHHDPSDVVDKFASIGQDYAGTGLSPAQRASNPPASGTDHFKIRAEKA